MCNFSTHGWLVGWLLHLDSRHVCRRLTVTIPQSPQYSTAICWCKLDTIRECVSGTVRVGESPEATVSTNQHRICRGPKQSPQGFHRLVPHCNSQLRWGFEYNEGSTSLDPIKGFFSTRNIYPHHYSIGTSSYNILHYNVQRQSLHLSGFSTLVCGVQQHLRSATLRSLATVEKCNIGCVCKCYYNTTPHHCIILGCSSYPNHMQIVVPVQNSPGIDTAAIH